MESRQTLGMICGYYLSKFDKDAYKRLGYSSQKATHEGLGKSLEVNPNSISQWRDEFDPIHPNSRQGWHRREMLPSRKNTVNALGHLSAEALLRLVEDLRKDPDGKIARSVVRAVEKGSQFEHTSKMNRWWVRQDREQFWLEVTGRTDLGADLNAPLRKEGGGEQSTYATVGEVEVGDVVYHYHKKRKAIVARSIVEGRAQEETVIWGAIGPSARKKSVQPYKRPGRLVAIAQYQELVDPVLLADIRKNEKSLLRARERLEKRYGEPLYQPFERSKKRPTRPLPGYLFKLPAEYVEILGLPISGYEIPDLPEELGDEEPLYEGLIKRISVNAYERNRTARGKCLDHHGYSCSVCDFDFEGMYGERGRNFIHVHHIVPISEVGEGYEVDPVRDLIPVCPNCHAMLHKSKPACTIRELKRALEGLRARSGKSKRVSKRGKRERLPFLND